MIKHFLSLAFTLLCGMGAALAYNITATSNPSGAGNITGAGSYEAGATCTLTAAPVNGSFSFVFWSKDGSFVSFDDEISFIVTEDAHYVAEFSYDTYLISAVAVPTEGGTVAVTGGIDGTNGFYYGQSCTLTATPNAGYTFINWTRDGTPVSSTPTYTFTVTSSGNYEAHFATGVMQTTHLNAGWNWYSTYIEQEGIDGMQMIKDGLGTNGEVIKSKSKSVIYRNGTWIGEMNIVNEGSYRIKTSAACDVTMSGTQATPSAHPITLTPGWTWIGYPLNEEMSVIEALANLTPSAGDVIKSKNQTAVYRNGAWMNSFTITPGMGLMYKSNNTGNVILVFPTNP